MSQKRFAACIVACTVNGVMFLWLLTGARVILGDELPPGVLPFLLVPYAIVVVLLLCCIMAKNSSSKPAPMPPPKGGMPISPATPCLSPEGQIFLSAGSSTFRGRSNLGGI